MPDIIDRNHLKGFILAASAGTLWSFGALIVRYMVAAQIYQWHYLYYRGARHSYLSHYLSHHQRGGRLSSTACNM